MEGEEELRRTPESDVVVDGGVRLSGSLYVPEEPKGVVLFAHGSGSSRHSPRNRYVARVLQRANLATLLMDLLTPTEEAVDWETGGLRFDIPLLAERVLEAIEWLQIRPETAGLKIGIFGASTGAAAALVAAAQRPQIVSAVVSRGGRPDLASPGDLRRVQAPTLLIVGGDDFPVVEMNQAALAELRCKKKLEIIPGATHLFEEPGALEQVAQLAREWFRQHLGKPAGEVEAA